MGIIITYQNAVSIANFEDKTESENEDYTSKIPVENDTYSMWAICDGAGGVGVFCKEWAKYLGENIPLNPAEFGFKESIRWFENVSKCFYENIIAKQNLSDLILQKKVFKEGSFSTLSISWIDKTTDEIFFSSIGDSCLFYFEKQNTTFQLKFITSLNGQKGIDDFPKLLNWNIETKEELPLDSMEILNDFIIVIASDSLAKWILLNLSLISILSEEFFKQSFIESLNSEKYQVRKINIKLGSNNSTSNKLLNFLKSSSIQQEKFKEAMISLYNSGEIDIDDFSLIYIEGNVSK